MQSLRVRIDGVCVELQSRGVGLARLIRNSIEPSQITMPLHQRKELDLTTNLTYTCLSKVTI
jgi:hypothetical protein